MTKFATEMGSNAFSPDVHVAITCYHISRHKVMYSFPDTQKYAGKAVGMLWPELSLNLGRPVDGHAWY